MRNLTMLTDLYQMTMMNGYIQAGIPDRIAVFDLFYRKNPGNAAFAVAAGLEQVIDYIENLHFDAEDIAYLRSLGMFTEDYLSYLSGLRFTGDVYAVREGEIVFPYEPIVTVVAPMLEAQLVETALLTFINHQTLIASKAAKICAAAGGGVMEFGLRRAQGADAGVYGARAAIIGGCVGTSNVYAGKLFGVPVSGTMAHSWVMNFPTELEAFRAYAESFPENCLLLVDTYDTLRSGVPNAIRVFRELREKGYEPKGIRLDSGDLAYLSKEARRMLDEAGFENAIICASGDLDEYLITSLKNQGAKIDLWGVGTKLITSADMPALGGVYKLSALYPKEGGEVPKIKLSDNSDKITNPAFKDVYRIYDNATGKAEADLIVVRGEKIDTGKPLTVFHPKDTWKRTTFTDYSVRQLTVPVIKGGKLVYELPPLSAVCEYAEREKETFWDEYKRLDNPHVYKVDLSQKLYDIKNKLISEIRAENA